MVSPVSISRPRDYGTLPERHGRQQCYMKMRPLYQRTYLKPKPSHDKCAKYSAHFRPLRSAGVAYVYARDRKAERPLFRFGYGGYPELAERDDVERTRYLMTSLCWLAMDIEWLVALGASTRQ